MGFHIGALHLHFQVYGCDSVKDKRRAFSALRTVWGKEPDLAVLETDELDNLSNAHWTIVAVGSSPAAVQQRLDSVEKAIASRVDAPILDTEFEWC